VVADGGGKTLAAAGLADVLGLAGDGVGGDVAAVAICVGGRDGLLVELGEEDVGDGVVDGGRRRFEEIGEADVQMAFAQADSGVERGEAAKADVERRNGSARTKFAVLLLEDSDQGVRSEGFWFWLRGARLFQCGIGTRGDREMVKEVEGLRRRGGREEVQELAQG
jgi:hypothetical protein